MAEKKCKNKYLLRRYLDDVNFHMCIRRRRSNSLGANGTDTRIASIQNPRTLFNMSSDLLAFIRNATQHCNYVKQALSEEVDTFFETPTDGIASLQSLESNWSIWKQNFILIGKDIEILLEKYANGVSLDDEAMPSASVSNFGKDDDDVDSIPEFSSQLLQEMINTLNVDQKLDEPNHDCEDGRRKKNLTKLSLVKSEPLHSRSGSQESSRESSILADLQVHGINDTSKDNDLDSHVRSSDTVVLFPNTNLPKEAEPPLEGLNTAQLLSLIPNDEGDSSDSLNLHLSSITSGMSYDTDSSYKDNKRKPKKILPKSRSNVDEIMEHPFDKCFVKISKKEKQMCDDLSKHRNYRIKRAKRHTKTSSSSSSSSSISDNSHISRWARKNAQRRRVIFSDDDDDNNDDSTCTKSASSPRSSASSRSSHDEDKYESSFFGSDLTEDEFNWSVAGDSDILNRITDIDESNSDYDNLCQDNKEIRTSPRKKNGETSKGEKNDDPEAAWRRDPLLTGSLYDRLFQTERQPSKTPLSKFSLKRPITLEESDDSDGDVQFVSSIKRKFAALPSRTENKLDVDLSSPAKKGRRNIKEIISEENLTEATQRAKFAEQQRIVRLKEKQNSFHQLSQTLPGVSVEDDLILDACEDNLVVVHRSLTKKLKEHQKCGVRFMWDNCYESVKRLNEDSGSGCILAHCMGLGKTLQVITLIHTLFQHPVTNTRKVLVICPLSTVLNWKNEFRMAMRLIKDPSAEINVYCFNRQQTQTEDRCGTVASWHKTGGVLLIGYEAFIVIVQRGIEFMNEALVKPGPDLVVCDEGHLLKNGKSNRNQVISKIATNRRIILTGTPMQNNLEEYYYMVAFVKPQFLGTYKEYRNRFINPINNGQYENSSHYDIQVMKKRSHVLHKMTKGFIQRYEASELNQYLPDKYDYVLKIELSDLQVKLYTKYNQLCQSTQDKLLFANAYILKLIWTHPKMLILQQERNDEAKQRMQRKRALTANPLDDDTMVDEIPNIDKHWWIDEIPSDLSENINYGRKFIVMMSILNECLRLDEKLLVFTSSILEIESIEKFIKQVKPLWRAETDYYRMDGKVPTVKRNQYCSQFNEPDSRVKLFLLTSKVGGLGLNLTGANRAIIMDISWNPTMDTQSIFRIYRLGQTKPCYIYRLVAKGTMEEVIYERSVTKQAIAGRVVDEMQISRHFKSSDLEAMYRCELSASTSRPTPKLPHDNILASLLQQHNFIYTYQDHNELLQNLPDEELDEEEMKLAWEEYEREKNYLYNPPIPYAVPPTFPSTSTIVPHSVPNRATYVPNMAALLSVVPTIPRQILEKDPLASNNNNNKKANIIILLEKPTGNVMMKFGPNGQPEFPNGAQNDTSDVQIQTATELYNSKKNIVPQTCAPQIYVIAPDGALKDFNRQPKPYQTKPKSRQNNTFSTQLQQVEPVIAETVNLVDDVLDDPLALDGDGPRDLPIIANDIPIDLDDL